MSLLKKDEENDIQLYHKNFRQPGKTKATELMSNVYHQQAPQIGICHKHKRELLKNHLNPLPLCDDQSY